MLLEKTEANADEKADKSVSKSETYCSVEEKKKDREFRMEKYCSLALSFLSVPNKRKYINESKRGFGHI